MNRPFARLLLPVVAGVALALAGGAPVKAAADAAAQPHVMDLADAWCFDDAPGFQYCFDVAGKAVFLDNKAGSKVTISQRFHTVVSKDGAFVGESTVVSLDQFRFAADGSVTMQVVENTRAAYDGKVCHLTVVLRIADYRIGVDHTSAPVCA